MRIPYQTCQVSKWQIVMGLSILLLIALITSLTQLTISLPKDLELYIIIAFVLIFK